MIALQLQSAELEEKINIDLDRCEGRGMDEPIDEIHQGVNLRKIDAGMAKRSKVRVKYDDVTVVRFVWYLSLQRSDKRTYIL